MADEQEKPEKVEITYTPEELATINELTNFFTRAPGQVNLDEGQEGGADGDAGDGPIATGDQLDEIPIESAAAEDATKIKRPVADLTKFDDVMNMDIDNFDAPPTEAEPVDMPLAEEPQAEAVPAGDAMDFDLPADGPVDLPGADPMVAAADTGDFALPGIEEGTPAPAEDMSFPETGAAPADAGAGMDFGHLY